MPSDGRSLTTPQASEHGLQAPGQRESGSAVAGALVALGLAFLAVVVLLGAAGIAHRHLGPRVATACAGLAIFIGVAQILYGLPIYLWARRRGLTSFCVGLSTGAAVVLAFNILFGVLVAMCSLKE